MTMPATITVFIAVFAPHYPSAKLDFPDPLRPTTI